MRSAANEAGALRVPSYGHTTATTAARAPYVAPVSLANLADDLPAVLRSAPCECPVSVPIRVRARYVREKVKDPTVHATAAQRLARNDRPAHAGARTAPSLESALCELWSIEQTSRSRVQGLQIIGVQSVIYRATEPPPLGLRIRWTKEKDASWSEEKLAKIAPAHCRLSN